MVQRSFSVIIFKGKFAPLPSNEGSPCGFFRYLITHNKNACYSVIDIFTEYLFFIRKHDTLV